MLYTLRFFPSKCSLFHDANLFGSCIIHVLYTRCAKLKKNNSGAKGLSMKLQKRFKKRPKTNSVPWRHCIVFCVGGLVSFNDAIHCLCYRMFCNGR